MSDGLRQIGRVRVRKTPGVRNEFQVMAWDTEGKRFADADCFESDREAAEGTARAMMGGTWVGVAGERDQSFGSYADACAWLDKVSPATSGRGFTTEPRNATTTVVRHADTIG